MATTFKSLYPADTVQLTMTGFGALASSSTFVAGWEFANISNVSNLDLDHHLSGVVQVGTTPTINTYIQIYAFAPLSYISSSFVWPDVMDGTASVETWTSAGVRDGASVLLKTILVDATTSNRNYHFGGLSIAAAFGGVLPWSYGIFIAHNTGVNLNSTDGNHQVNYTRYQVQGV